MPFLLPNALVIGPQKSGTTWLYRYLRSRNDICLPVKVKETFFFDRYYGRGLRWYSSHFQGCIDARWVIEVAPTYFQSVEAALRIKKELGTIPLVSTLREPVDRTFSLYLHMLRYGMTRLSFRDAVTRHPELLDGSRYAKHLGRWFELFGIENILVLFQEDLAESPDRYVKPLCRHLNMSVVQIDEDLNRRINEAALPYSSFLAASGQYIADKLRARGMSGIVNYAKQLGLKGVFFGRPGVRSLPSISGEDRSWLLDNLLPEIDSLEQLLSVDLSHWKSDRREE